MLDQVFHEFPHKEAFLFGGRCRALTATSIKELTQALMRFMFLSTIS